MSNVLEEKVMTEDAELYAEIKSWLVDHGINQFDAGKISTLVSGYATAYAVGI